MSVYNVAKDFLVLPTHRNIWKFILEKSYKYEDCHKAFLYHSFLRRLEAVHREKPYKCEEYGKCLFFSSTLKRHQIIHYEVSLYECGECLKLLVCCLLLRNTNLFILERNHTSVTNVGKPCLL